MKKGSRHGSDRGSKNQGRSTGGQGGSKGKGAKRDIKNARSLADVLGVSGGKRAPVSERYQGPRRGRDEDARGGEESSRRKPEQVDRRHSFNRPSNASGEERGEGPHHSKGPQSKKLTYIMSFQPPGTAPAADAPTSKPASRGAPKESGREQKREQVRRDNRETKNLRDTRAPKEEAPREIHTRADYSWPKERAKQAEPQAEEPRRGRRERPGARRVTGLVKRHPDGFGFLIADQPDTPDVYISRQAMTGIMTNDRVEVELYTPRGFSKSKEERLSGEVVRVLSRANTRVVGKYLPVDHKYGVLLDENRGWGADLRIAAKDSMDAKEGEMVAVEITQYPDEDHEFTGRVVSLIGDVEDPVNDVIRVVHQAGIPTEFSKEAIADARKFGGQVTDQERKGREDLRDIPLITIDGVTARDFDDAIFVEQTESGFHLIVAIADVSHYVKPGTRLDEEAYERGTSTYFPNYVVPMLPEELSNELCSLKPNVDRLCFCCEMQIDFQGVVTDYRFFEGVMKSQARVTYGEAQEVIDAHASGATAGSKTVQKLKHVEENILRAADLAKILMAKRFREGSLDLEVPETQVVVDSTGESTDVIRSERLFAHRLIEELMLVTNICTAKFLDESKVPGVYRIHEEPEQDSIRALQRYLWNLGGSRSVMGKDLAKKLTKALEAMSGRPEAAILNILTLRTMQQAKYSPDNVGHFGLGFSHYSHFTSPIRRYPDLIAHRIIKSQLYSRYHSMQMTEDELASATTWLSACEQRSVKAERKVISIKKARFIRRFIGQEFDGLISSVAKFGCFVLLRQYDVDGLVRIEDLGPDRFYFDEENLRLIGNRTGLRYVIGDAIKVRVVGADPENGRVEFALAEIPEQAFENSDEDDVLDMIEGLEESDRGRGRRGKPGERSSRSQNERGRKEKARGARQSGQEERSGRRKKQEKRFGAEKRGKTSDNSSNVRKERVSKRRGKN